jgi:Tfp pilus assembly protein PilX
MKLIHALLAAAKAAFGISGNAPAALAVTAADAALTVGEQLLAQAKKTAVSPDQTVFVSTPADWPVWQHNDMVEDLRQSMNVANDRGDACPRIIVLPKGVHHWVGEDNGRVQA